MQQDNTLNNQLLSILSQLQGDGNLTARSLLETMFNIMMKAERSLHLEGNPEDKGNGYLHRELGTPLGPLCIQVPRDRDGDFRPEILPKPHQRDIDDRLNIIESLLVSGYAPSQIESTLKRLGMHYNQDELAQLKEHYLERFQQWQNREIDQDLIGIFVDVYHASVNMDGRVVKAAIYVVIGLDFSGQKSLLGLYVYKGHETKGFWLQTLNQLIERGLKCPLFVISDDFPGLKDAVNALFPQALHQLCTVHMQRNVHRHMEKIDAQDFNNEFNNIKNGKDFEFCIREFTALCSRYQEKYPAFIKGLLKDKENYFYYAYLPSEVRRYFYSTNWVESANSCLESLRMRMGGFFQSESAFEVNVYLVFERISAKKWQKGVPKIKGELHAFQQLFAQKYDRVPLGN